MQPAVLIARLVGPVFVALGLGILLNASFYAAAITEAVHSPTLIYLSGVAARLAVLNAHSAWPADWRVIVTIFGWLCVVGGVMRIVLPQLTASLATALYSGPTRLAIVGAVVLILGGYLSFEGYRLSPAQRRSLRA